MKWRQEHKYIISESDRILLSSRLSSVLQKDSHSHEDGFYTVRTLYFDDMENTALHDKIDGNPQRKKYRLRYYNLDTSFIKLERKTKSVSYGLKNSEQLTIDEAEKIISGETDFLIESDKKLFNEFYTESKLKILKPTVIIEYRREAFCLPYDNIRITLDSKIKSSNRTESFFKKSIPETTVLDNGNSVLEIKFDNFVPDFVKDIISPQITSAQAVSKYASGRKYY